MMSDIPNLEPMPIRVRRLPTDVRGYPVPFFVAEVNGVPDFRVMDPRKLALAVTRRLCWICGGPLGSFLTFTVGPMCTVNRISSEPPAHRECAQYAARVCPFLSRPHMRRRTAGLPEEIQPAGGVALPRNPGVTVLWTTHSYALRKVIGTEAPGAKPGVLFEMDTPTSVEWFAEGRDATRDEVLASMESGLPSLQELAVLDGPEACLELDRAVAVAKAWVPR
jgi:hypothetical protein